MTFAFLSLDAGNGASTYARLMRPIWRETSRRCVRRRRVTDRAGSRTNISVIASEKRECKFRPFGTQRDREWIRSLATSRENSRYSGHRFRSAITPRVEYTSCQPRDKRIVYFARFPPVVTACAGKVEPHVRFILRIRLLGRVDAEELAIAPRTTMV